MIEMKKRGYMSGQEAMDVERRHDSMMRLTDLGRQQAQSVGKWINENLGAFDKFYVSEYVRTKETAAEMALTHALWQAEMMIRERDQGVQDGRGDVKMDLTTEEMDRMKKSPMYWQPVAGESMSDVSQRVRLFLHRLQQNATGMKVVVVCHYRAIHAFRLLLEDTRQGDYEALLSESMPNCCLWWYSRRDETGRVRSHICTCKRIVVKPDGSAEVVNFPVKSQLLTDADLKAEVNAVKQVLNNSGVVSSK
jgi:broad specificity phosphatase PhoE